MKRKVLAIPVAGLAVFMAFHPGCKKGDGIPRLGKGETFNLLLITVDSLRADRLGAFGFEKARTPNIDRLAKNGVMFRNCYAPAPLSFPSHCTIFTGREPIAHRVHNQGTDRLSESEETWAEVMKDHDYETYALVSSYPLHSKFGLKQGFDTYDDSLDINQIIASSSPPIAADRIFIKFQSWLEQRPAGKFFAWVNFGDPQAPYEPPQEYAGMVEGDPYSGEVAFVDHYIGQIVAGLEAGQLLDRTVIVIAGSHGEAFYEHGEGGHGLFCYDETLKVPLVIYHPAVFPKNQVIADRVALLDLMPSLLELFGLAVPPGVQGRGFWPLLSKKGQERRTERPIYFESLAGSQEMGFAPLTGIIADPFKWISLPEAELYDLQADPAETDNLALKKNDVAIKMAGLLKSYVDDHSGEKPELQGAENKGQEQSQALDPKKGLAAVERLLKADHLIRTDELVEAEKELAAIERDYQGWKPPQVFDERYLLYKKRADAGKVEETLRQAVARYPEVGRFAFSLAQVYSDAGRLEEAEKICSAELARDPRSSEVNILLGRIYHKKGESRLALSCLEKALQEEPHNAALQVERASQLETLGEKGESLNILENLLKNRVLIADPASADIKAEIAGVLLKLGEAEMAKTLLLDVIAAGKGNSLVWTQVGLGDLSTGNLPKALESLAKALSLDPRNALALSGMGTLHLSLFRLEKRQDVLEKAISYYAQAREISPQMVAAINGLGVAFRYAGDAEKAIALWKQALEIDPGFTNTYFNLGITLIEAGRRQEARRYLSLCRDKYSDRLAEKEKQQLDALIAETKE